MVEGFVSGTVELTLMLAAAISTVAGIFGGIYLIIKNSSLIKKWRAKKRLATCPVQHTSMTSLGGLIVLFGCLAIERGHLSDYQRAWLRDAFDTYESCGGNGPVKDIFMQTRKLPPTPPPK